MDAELIEQLAREAGLNVLPEAGCRASILNPHDYYGDQGDMAFELRRFAALVADECSKEAERIISGKHKWSFVSDGKTYASEQAFIAAGVASAIRAKFPPPPV